MKVLLIWPPSPDYCVLTEDLSCCEPLPLEYLASPLLEEFDVEIVDMRLEKKDIQEIIANENPDVVGISFPYSAVVNSCNRLMKEIKDHFPGVTLVIGGHHPTVTLDYIHLEYVDFVVVGEGSSVFHSLLKAIQHKKGMDTIPNLYYKEQGQFKFTFKKELDSIESLKFPARHLVKKYGDVYFHAHYKPVSLIRFSYGCPYNCSFCVLWKLCNRKYLTRSNEQIIEELKTIEKPNVYVVDDEAFIKVDKMYDLADKIAKEKINKKYHMYVRSDTIAKNPDLFEKWAQIGLDSVLIGLESTVVHELKAFNKDISVDVAHKCMEIMHNNGIEVRANFIVSPNYDEEDFDNLKKQVLSLNIDRPTFAVHTPLFGTDDYLKMKDNFIVHKLEFFDCYHTFVKTKLPIKRFYERFVELFKFAADRKESGAVFYGKGDSLDVFLEKIRNSYQEYPQYFD